MTTRVRRSILKDGWVKKPAMTSLVAASLLFTTSLVAATMSTVQSGQLTPNVAPATRASDRDTETGTASATESTDIAQSEGIQADLDNLPDEDAPASVAPATVSVEATPEALDVSNTDASNISQTSETTGGDISTVSTELPKAGIELPEPVADMPDEATTGPQTEPLNVVDSVTPADHGEDEPTLSPEVISNATETHVEERSVDDSQQSTKGVQVDDVVLSSESENSEDTDAIVSDAVDASSDDVAVAESSDSVDSLSDNESDATAMPVAEDVDLSEPVVLSEDPTQTPAQETLEAAVESQSESKDESVTKPPLVLLGEEVAPGTSARLSWSPAQHFDGISVPTPVLVVNGVNPGKTVCLTAAIHGDELNGIEIVRRVLYDLDPEDLSGTVIGVPIVNLQGFRRNSRYLPDRRDLNRFFPGKPGGSSAARMAHSFFSQVIIHCDALVDIHTGSFLRTNLPQLRADMSVPEVAELTEGFGATAVLHSTSAEGTLRRAAVLAGIPAVTLETGEPSRLQEKEIEHGTKGIQTLLTKLKMTRRVRVWGDPEPVYYKSTWVRADDGGLLFSSVKLGQRVREGQVLGTITDPITNVRNELVSPSKGRVLGMALNQVVLPGFATFRIGIPSNEKEMVVPSDLPPEARPERPAFDYAAPDQFAPDIPESVPSEVDLEDENS